MRARAAEAAIESGTPIDDAAELIGEGTSPSSDRFATAEFRRHLRESWGGGH